MARPTDLLHERHGISFSLIVVQEMGRGEPCQTGADNGCPYPRIGFISRVPAVAHYFGFRLLSVGRSRYLSRVVGTRVGSGAILFCVPPSLGCFVQGNVGVHVPPPLQQRKGESFPAGIPLRFAGPYGELWIMILRIFFRAVSVNVLAVSRL